MSVRVDELVVVSPSGRSLATMAEEDLVVIDSGGSVVDGWLAPTSETPLHLAIYAATDAGAIAHVHATASTALSCVQESRGGDALPALHYNVVNLGGPIRVAPYALYGSDELAANVVGALRGGRAAALMANHGSLAYGDTIEQACDRIELVEWLSELDIRAHSVGTPQVLGEEQLREVSEKINSTGYGRR